MSYPFTVYLAKSADALTFTKEDRFEFLDGGVLRVDTNEEARYFPPTVWTEVRHDYS
ncbi:hypothetical protein ACFV24_32925 [Nocardia fluminea]|uniref:hypothetical protein n=1 Tax=Nocardia fluminea TaxID=134984 RepID=UPI0036701C16